MLSFFLSFFFFVFFFFSSHILRAFGVLVVAPSPAPSFSQCTLEAPSPTAEKLSQSSHTPPTPFGTPQFGTTFHAFSLGLVSSLSCLIEGRTGKFVSVAVHTSRRRSPHSLPSYQPLPISAPDYSADLASQAPFWRQFFLCACVQFDRFCGIPCRKHGFAGFVIVWEIRIGLVFAAIILSFFLLWWFVGVVFCCVD